MEKELDLSWTRILSRLKGVMRYISIVTDCLYISVTTIDDRLIFTCRKTTFQENADFVLDIRATDLDEGIGKAIRLAMNRDGAS